MSTNNKGQALTFDFVIATAVFLAVLSLIVSYWYYSMLQMQEIMDKNMAVNSLVLASDIWFAEGYPKYWDTSSIREIGLSNENRINRTKMEMLPQIGYSNVTTLLSLGAYSVQYNLYSGGSEVFAFPSFNITCLKNTYIIERISILDEKPVRIRTILCD